MLFMVWYKRVFMEEQLLLLYVVCYAGSNVMYVFIDRNLNVKINQI